MVHQTRHSFPWVRIFSQQQHPVRKEQIWLINGPYCSGRYWLKLLTFTLSPRAQDRANASAQYLPKMVVHPSLGIEDTQSCDIFAPNVSQQCPHFQLVQVYISHFFSPLVQTSVHNKWDKLASHNRGTLTPQRVLQNAWWRCHQISKMELPPSPKLPRQRTQRGWSPGATTSASSWRTASQGLMSRAATRRRPTFRLSYKGAEEAGK